MGRKWANPADFHLWPFRWTPKKRGKRRRVTLTQGGTHIVSLQEQKCVPVPFFLSFTPHHHHPRRKLTHSPPKKWHRCASLSHLPTNKKRHLFQGLRLHQTSTSWIRPGLVRSESGCATPTSSPARCCCFSLLRLTSTRPSFNLLQYVLKIWRTLMEKWWTFALLLHTRTWRAALTIDRPACPSASSPSPSPSSSSQNLTHFLSGNCGCAQEILLLLLQDPRFSAASE